jgi:hypothetical protein
MITLIPHPKLRDNGSEHSRKKISGQLFSVRAAIEGSSKRGRLSWRVFHQFMKIGTYRSAEYFNAPFRQ